MNQLNIFDETLHECCSDPLTGFFRDGFCNTNEQDQGLHIVCCLIDDKFLQLETSYIRESMNNNVKIPVDVFSVNYNFLYIQHGKCKLEF